MLPEQSIAQIGYCPSGNIYNSRPYSTYYGARGHKSTAVGTASSINCCVQVAVATSQQVKQADGSAKRGLQWEVPLMLSKAKEGSDRNRIQCMVFDFVVHRDTCRMALNNARFKVQKPMPHLAQNCLLGQCPAAALLCLSLHVLIHRNAHQVQASFLSHHWLPD